MRGARLRRLGRRRFAPTAGHTQQESRRTSQEQHRGPARKFWSRKHACYLSKVRVPAAVTLRAVSAAFTQTESLDARRGRIYVRFDAPAVAAVARRRALWRGQPPSAVARGLPPVFD